MNTKYMYSLLAVIVLALISYFLVEAASGFKVLFGVIIPYLAFLLFIVGFIYRMMNWARIPVPFRITTTCGQQKSLPWITPNRIDNPFSKGAVVVRMFLEIVFFRSLFRNTRLKMKSGPKIAYNLEIFLWAGALAFHWAFLTVLLRHLRFFTEPVPILIQALENVDSFFRIEILYDVAQFGLPGVYLSGIVLLAAVTYLFLRRVFMPNVRYISLAADFFPLFLIFGIVFTGILMRYVTKIDVTAAKELTMGLVTFHPTIPDGVSSIFFVHLFFVSILMIYFPFSKLMHLGGIFLSPTRNMTADTRANRHVNPWNYPVHVHTYEEYEDEFREKMVEAGLPVVKQPVETSPDESEEKE
ncbi:MAG: sulfate reduction electron transfer complex DsrMKJOP subunit DsrM [Deltaproteobacteria bacterium]|nr:sulfate reduction electron transfer complex DsrMKJOP subunit DsrM [Deltaproteobacteria bacterium]